MSKIKKSAEFLCVGVGLSLSVVATAANKCVDSSGKATYQDLPCKLTDKGTTVKIYPPAETEGEGFYERAQREIIRPAKLARKKELEARALNNEVALGMTTNMVMAAWGMPLARTTATSPTGYIERWTYRRDGVMKSVVFLDNEVVQMDH